MTNALAMVGLLAVAAAAGFAALGPIVMMASRRRWPPAALAAWAVAIALLVCWAVAEYRSGVQADADRTSGSILSEVWWLLAAVVCAAAAVALTRQDRR